MSHSLIKLLRTLAVQKRSDSTEIAESQIVEDAKCILNSESIVFSLESEIVRLGNFLVIFRLLYTKISVFYVV